MSDVTIKDIARIVGVSHPTVSKALNNMPGVNEETRRKIVEAAKKMKYVPNTAAKRLSNKKNRSIGFIWQDPEGLFLYHLCRLLQKEAALRDIDVFMSMSKSEDALKNFHEHFIDFILCWALPGWIPKEAFINAKDAYGGQLMLMGGGAVEGAHLIDIDRAGGISKAVAYLAYQGHRKVAFFGKKTDKTTGYLTGMLENGMEYHKEYIVMIDSDYYDNQQMYHDELKRKLNILWSSENRPTALVLDSQNLAIGFINVFRELNISIPEDLSIITYDDIPEFSMYPVPLTTCSPSCAEMVKYVLDTFEECYENDGKNISKKVQIKPELIIRKSIKKI